MPSTLVQVCAWVGAACGLAAYALVTARRFDARSRRAAVLNIVSCFLLGVANTYAQLWGSLAYCVIWILIALGPLLTRSR